MVGLALEFQVRVWVAKSASFSQGVRLPVSQAPVFPSVITEKHAHPPRASESHN